MDSQAHSCVGTPREYSKHPPFPAVNAMPGRPAASRDRAYTSCWPACPRCAAPPRSRGTRGPRSPCTAARGGGDRQANQRGERSSTQQVRGKVVHFWKWAVGGITGSPNNTWCPWACFTQGQKGVGFWVLGFCGTPQSGGRDLERLFKLSKVPRWLLTG